MTSGSHIRLSEITPQCVRLEFSRKGRFVDAPSVVARARAASRVVASSRVGEVIELDTASVRLRCINDGLAFHPRNTRAVIAGAGGPPVTWRPGDEPRRNLGGTLRTLDGVRGPVDVGDGVLSRDGWFLLDDSHSPLLVDGWPFLRDGATGGDPDYRDWYLFAYGLDYHAALRALATVTGRVALPPRALLGSWYSRFWPYTAGEFKEIVEQYAVQGFGLDVLVLDMDWHKPGWTGWSWNRELIPDPGGLLRWLHARGLMVTLNLHPADGVGPHEDRYPDFMRALGRDPASGETVPFDPGDRRYVDALRSTVLAPLHADGNDFWWLDWQQHHYTPSLSGPGGITNLRQLNAVLALDAAAATEGEARRPAILSRWAGWGDQLHPVHFSGDAHAGWRSLAFQVPFTVTSGNVLCCFWSHDIGGHFGARDEECVARWVQFGAVSGALRLHSARSSVLDRRPWTCAPMFAESMRRAFGLRATLMPTIYGAAHRCAADAVPLLRPMYLDHAGDELAYSVPAQYMLGDLLAAPMTAPGVGEQRVSFKRVWLPESLGAAGQAGTRIEAWYDWFTGERFIAGREAIVAADIDEFPLYAPAGIPVLLAPPDHPMGSSVLSTLVIRAFPVASSSAASTTLYEDDGRTGGYLDGEHALTPVHAKWSVSDTGGCRVQITVDARRGAFAGQQPTRGYILEIPCATASADAARVDGQPVAVELVPGTPEAPPMCRVHVASRPAGRPTEISLEFTPVDPALLERQSRHRRLEAALDEAIPESSIDDALKRLGRDVGRNVPQRVGFDAVLAIASGVGVVPDGSGFRLVDSLGAAAHGRFSVTIMDDVAAARRAVRQLTLAAAPGVGVAIDDPEPPLASPPIGVRASRIVRAEFVARAGPTAFETRLRTRLTPVQSWHIAGPFPFDDHRPFASQVYGPERADPVHWRPVAPEPGVDGFDGRYAVDLSRHTNPGDRLVYAAAIVRSPRSLAATLALESGDRLQAWLNGALVFSSDPGETMDSSRGSVAVSLRAGPNELLLKVSGGGGGFGFTAAFDAGEALDDQPV